MTSKENQQEFKFTPAGDRYICIVNEDLLRYPVHVRKRTNGTWKAIVYQYEKSIPIYTEIGISRYKVTLEAADWLHANMERINLEADFRDIECAAVESMIRDDDAVSLSTYMERDVIIEKDKNGNFNNLLVEVVDEDDEDEDDDEFV